MAINNYYCRNCNLQTTTDKSPNDNGCSKSSQHSWVKLGESGNTLYQCRNCTMQVKSKDSPNKNGCGAKGVSNTHIWIKY